MDPFFRAAHGVLDRCQALSQFTETPGSIQRTFLCQAMHDVHKYLGSWMETLGMTVSVDAIGNLRGVYPGRGLEPGRVLIASHLDTVPNAGAYDGVLGVVAAIALIELLGGDRLAFEIEVIGFSEEEGVRFSVLFLGSRAVADRLDDAAIQTRDANGVTVAEAIRAFGLNPDELPRAEISPSSRAYLEIHIEQGPVLEKAGLPLAFVESIAGQSRAIISFRGKANHAGTTPMTLRHDALCAAAEWILAVEQLGRRTHGLVATVGKIEAMPGAGNVISGSVMASLDVRHGIDRVREEAFDRLVRQGQEIASRRGIKFSAGPHIDQPAVAMDPVLVKLAAESICAAGVTPLSVVSGAGHDAMIIAERLPSAMIFVRSPGGISHHPNETVLVEDVQSALIAGNHFLRNLSL